MELNKIQTLLKEKGVRYVFINGIKYVYHRLRYFVDLSLGYFIHETPIFNRIKRDFYGYYNWPGLPSPLYKNVPTELMDKYQKFVRFGKIKKWLFYCWRMYTSKKIGNGKLDDKDTWTSESGKDKHLWNLANFEELKIKNSLPFCQLFIKLLKGSKTRRVLEIGCGCGGWLDYFQGHYSGCEYHGYDINEEIIRFDSTYYKDKNILFFHSGSLSETLSRVRPDVVLFCGTAEFIPQAELLNMIECIKRYEIKYIVFYEPISMPFDFKTDFESKKRGELADTFNHNYPYLLESDGYTVKYIKQLIPDTVRKYGMHTDVRGCIIIGEYGF